jgi:hypothetical protein
VSGGGVNKDAHNDIIVCSSKISTTHTSPSKTKYADYIIKGAKKSTIKQSLLEFGIKGKFGIIEHI